MALTSQPLVNPIFPGSGSSSSSGTPLEGTPKTHRTSVTTVAPGIFTDLDALQISSGLTGRLCGLVISATVSLQGTVHTVSDGVASGPLLDLLQWNGSTLMLEFKDTRFFTISESAAVGIDTFRVTVQNCDNNASGDIFVTFLWEEVS